MLRYSIPIVFVVFSLLLLVSYSSIFAKADLIPAWTDKTDYTAGEDLYLSGQSFSPNSVISIEMVLPNQTTSSYQVNSDNSGKFDFDYVIDQLLGNYVLNVNDASNSSSLNILVIENHAPEIISNPKIVAKVGETYTYSVEAVDQDNHKLTFSLLSFPEGMAIDSQTGQITWTPSPSQIGMQEVAVQVSDIHSSTYTQMFNVFVSE